MSSFNNVKKVNYTDNRDSVVALKEYICFKDEIDKKQFVIFKFQNNLNQQLSKMTFNVMQYDSDNFMIKKTMVNYEDFTAERGELFVPKMKMELDIFTDSIQIELTYAKFERVEFNNGVMKPIPYTMEDFRQNNEEKPKPSKKELKVLEKNRIKELKRNNKKNDTRSIMINDVTNRNKPHSTIVLTSLLSICLVVFVVATATIFWFNSKLFNDGNYMYKKIDNDTLSIYKYYGNESDIVIPEKYQNYTITEIDKKAFKDKGMSTLTFTSPITINTSAFEGCKNLYEIKGTEYINEIKNRAFKNCYSLTSFSSNDVDLIGVEAFKGCKSLKEVILPNTTIDSKAFNSDLALTHIEMKDTASGIRELSSIFGGDNNLESLKIYKKTIEKGYFIGMDKLTKLEFGIEPNVEFGALEGTKIANHYINNSVETLNGKIIAINLNAEIITLPSTITDKEQAFEFLATYKSQIYILQTEMNILIDSNDISIFENLRGFGISDYGTVDRYILTGYYNNITEIYWDSSLSIAGVLELPSSVNTIVLGNDENTLMNIDGQLVGLNSYNIDTLVINRAKNVMSGSLNNLLSLKYLDIYNFGKISLNNLCVSNNLEQLRILANEENLDVNCSVETYPNLYYIEFPDITVNLNANLEYCSNLKQITIPRDTTTINSNGSYFIKDCGITSIVFNEKLKTIGNNFIYKSTLQSIIIPDTVTTLGNNMFVECQNLNIIQLPVKLESMGAYLIDNTPNIDEYLCIPNTVKKIATPVVGENCPIGYVETPFVGSDANNTVSYSSFNKSASNTWYLRIFGNVDISNNFFTNLDNLDTLIVDGKITGARSGSFSNLVNLENLKINGEFNCKFNELFGNSKPYMNSVIIDTTSQITPLFFSEMVIDSLAINSYKGMNVESFNGSNITYLFIGKNGDLSTLRKTSFYDQTKLTVTNLYLEIEKPTEASEYGYVSGEMTYRDFVKNYTSMGEIVD